MFVRRHQRRAKKTLLKIRPSKSTRLKEKTSDDAAVCSKKTPLVHSDLYSSLSPNSQPGTDGKNCTTLNVTPRRDCSDQSVPCMKKRKKLSLRKQSCLNPPLANDPTKMSCVLDESLPDLCILQSDTEDSCLSTVTKSLVGDTHCSEKTKDIAQAGCRTLNDTQIVDDIDGQMSISLSDISSPYVSLLSSSVSQSNDEVEVTETSDVLLLPTSTSTSGSNDTNVSGSPDVVELSPTLNCDPERSNSVNATKAQHTDEELLSDVVDITECTCDENPWLCDKCVAELNSWKTRAPHEEPTVDSVEQELSVGTLLPPPAVEQEHLCDETSRVSKTSITHIENAETETVNKSSVSAVDQVMDAKMETVNKCSASAVPQVQDAKMETVNKSSVSAVPQVMDAKMETVNKCSASAVPQVQDAKMETVNKCSASAVPQVMDAKMETVNKSSASAVPQVQDAKMETVNKSSVSAVPQVMDAKMETVNKCSASAVPQVMDAKMETVNKCSASAVPQVQDAKMETVNKSSASAVPQVQDAKMETVNKSSASAADQVEISKMETISKCSASAVQLEDAKTETVNTCSMATTDPTAQCHPTHLDTPVCSHDDVCQSNCSSNYFDKNSSESAVVLTKKLILQTKSTEEKCSCKETKGRCPQCTAKLDNSWSETYSKDCAEITKPTKQGLGSETTSSVVQEGQCTCGVVTGLCSVCVAKLDGLIREDGRKCSTNVAVADTFRHASPWQPAVILSNQECTCNETSGHCPSCLSKVNNSKIATATTTVIKDPASRQATTVVRQLKRRYVIETGSATVAGNISVPPKKKQRVASTSGQPASIANIVSRMPRCKRQYRCLACGIMVTTAKLFQCANGHSYCRHCVKDLAKHTVVSHS